MVKAQYLKFRVQNSLFVGGSSKLKNFAKNFVI